MIYPKYIKMLELLKYIGGYFEQFLCTLASWVDDPNGENFKKHLARIPDYLWVAEDGLVVQVSITICN